MLHTTDYVTNNKRETKGKSDGQVFQGICTVTKIQSFAFNLCFTGMHYDCFKTSSRYVRIIRSANAIFVLSFIVSVSVSNL